MPPLVSAKVLLPKRALANPKRLLRAIENTLTAAAKAAKVDFDATTYTWHNLPKFEIEKSPGKRIVYTTSDIYRYVSRGTKVRFAVMSDDFRPKTRPGYIGSNLGRGGKVGMSRVPLPGIEARDFEKVIARKWRQELPKQFQRMIDAEFGGDAK